MLITTGYVTFTNAKRAETTSPPVPVRIRRMDREGRLRPASVEYAFCASFAATVRYPSGKRISGGDLINWDRLPAGAVAISKPRTTYGFPPMIEVYFKESD